MFIGELAKFLANLANPSGKDAPSSPVSPAQGTSVPPEEPSPSALKATPTPSTDANVSQGQEPSTGPKPFMPPLKQPEEKKELTQVSGANPADEADQEKPAQEAELATSPATEEEKSSPEVQEHPDEAHQLIPPVKEEDARNAVDEAFNSIRLEREERERKRKFREEMKHSQTEEEAGAAGSKDAGEQKEFVQVEFEL